jgi:hypothetical protein
VPEADVRQELVERFSTLDGAVLGEGAFSAGPALWVGKREIAHFDGDGSLDVRLTKRVIRSRRSMLKEDERVTLRASASDWLEVRVEVVEDIEFALALVNESIAANQASSPPGAPPTGAELERRRRFH